MLCYVDMVKKIHYITIACRLHGCLKLKFNILNEKGSTTQTLTAAKDKQSKVKPHQNRITRDSTSANNYAFTLSI